MLTIVTSYTRPNTSVPFFVKPQEFTTMFNNNYVLTGKLIESKTEMTNNGLTAVVTAKWRTRADFSEFLAEPLRAPMRANRTAHMNAHGIILDQTITFTPSEGDTSPAPSSN